jgi:hypothetical protein
LEPFIPGNPPEKIMKKLKIMFVVTYQSEGQKYRVVSEDYSEAFQFFSKKESEGKSPILYRETAEVCRQVLLRAGTSA